MKNKLIALYSGTVLGIMACSSTSNTVNNNKKPTKNPPSSSMDTNLASANALCKNGKYDLAFRQLDKSYIAASTGTKPSINKQQAQVISAYGDCYSIQAKYDTAIESYETALQSKYPPNSGYIGITKAYLVQSNYPKASLYISSYPGDENTKEVLQLKIKALSGLLNNGYDISPSNRKLLQNKLAQLKNSLAKLNNNQPSNSATTVGKQNNNINPQAITTSSQTKNTSTNTVVNKPIKPQKFKDRIQVSSNGRHYIIVEHGDTLFNVAKKSNITQDKLIQINHLKNDYAPLGIRIYLD